MKLNKYWFVAVALSLSVFCESMTYTYVQQQGAVFYYSSSLVYFIAGILVCILPLINSVNADGISGSSRLQKFLPALFYLLLGGLLVYHVIFLSSLYKRWAIDAQLADMIPVIQLACKRLLHGLPVYAPMDEIKPGEWNAYLPMMWAPFLPAELFGFDPRWVTLAALFLALAITATPLLKAQKKIPLIPLCIAAVSLFLLLNYFLMKYPGFWAMTQEGVVAGFYMLLAFGLLRQNPYIIGLGMACCLLSRYTLLFWIPVYLGYLFFTAERSFFIKLFLTFSGLMLALFVIPYFIWAPAYFISLPAHQAGGFAWFWESYHIPARQYHNVGLFKFFAIEQVSTMTWWEVIGGFSAPLLFIALTHRWLKNNTTALRFIGFGSLKISLIFFYNFIPTPYMYLFFPVTLLSYPVLFDFLAANKPVMKA